LTRPANIRDPPEFRHYLRRKRFRTSRVQNFGVGPNPVTPRIVRNCTWIQSIRQTYDLNLLLSWWFVFELCVGPDGELWVNFGESILSNAGIGTTQTVRRLAERYPAHRWLSDSASGSASIRASISDTRSGMPTIATQFQVNNPPPTSQQGMAIHSERL